ncbi:hypothetical protein PoB_005522700 [Plakobranchus ocellatus]|uniref:Uncharacterized protein n=1 Tax=Plakobranchus ocellatus TaxID=259542 RepID=A0AAV4CB13_9GAST|nr:hypothetical protein PoB_005522700 [Plakobranchus ocellatus]
MERSSDVYVELSFNLTSLYLDVSKGDISLMTNALFLRRFLKTFIIITLVRFDFATGSQFTAMGSQVFIPLSARVSMSKSAAKGNSRACEENLKKKLQRACLDVSGGARPPQVKSTRP